MLPIRRCRITRCYRVSRLSGPPSRTNSLLKSMTRPTPSDVSKMKNSRSSDGGASDLGGSIAGSSAAIVRRRASCSVLRLSSVSGASCATTQTVASLGVRHEDRVRVGRYSMSSERRPSPLMSSTTTRDKRRPDWRRREGGSGTLRRSQGTPSSSPSSPSAVRARARPGCCAGSRWCRPRSCTGGRRPAD